MKKSHRHNSEAVPSPVRRSILMAGIAAAATGAATAASPSDSASATTTGKAQYDAEYVSRLETYDPRLWGARGDVITDDTFAFQQAIDEALRTRGTVSVTRGNYCLDSITLPSLVALRGLGGDVARFASGQQGGVNLFHRPDSRAPMIIVDGNGCGLDRLNLVGNGSPAPLLSVVNGFESRFSTLQLSDVRGPALTANRVNNNTWNDIFINSCGTEDEAAMTIKSRGGANAQFTNAFTCFNLTVEGSPNVALDLGFGSSEDDYLEFVHLYNLHVEHDSQSRLTKEQKSMGLVRMGNVRNAELVSPFIVGGPGPLLVHDDNSRYRPELMSGLRLIGGSFVGAPSDWNDGLSDHLVELRHGNDFATLGTRFGRFSGSAIVAGPDYGALVSLDSATTAPDERDGSLLRDERSTPERSEWAWAGSISTELDVTVGGHLSTATRTATPVVDVLSANGARAPKPRILGNDVAGTVFFGSGSDPASGPNVRVTFTRPFPSPPTVVVSAVSKSSTAVTAFVKSRTDHFEIHVVEGLPKRKGGVEFGFAYVIVG